MSSVGFVPKFSEIERLRDAYSSLNDITRNLVSAARCLEQGNWKLAEAHIKAAQWHAAQAKEKIASVAQAKTEPTKRENV
jgi:hypothetical protein